TARLYFVNTVEPKSFPENWNRWQPALFDGTADELVHPVLGRVLARVLDGSIELVAKNRAGIIVDVTWTSTREELDQGLIFETLNGNTEAAAGAADAALDALGMSLPVTVPPTTSLLDAYKGLKGQIFSAELSVTGAINQLMGVIDTLVDDIDALNSALGWA